MELSASEKKQLQKLLSDEHTPAMIIWTEKQANGDTSATGCVQGNPIEVVMMTIHAIDYAAKSLGIKPEQALKKIAQFIEATKK